MTTTAKLPLQVLVGLVDKLTNPWTRMNAQVRMQVQTLERFGKRATIGVTAPLAAFAAFATFQASRWETLGKRIRLFTGLTESEAQRSAQSIRDYASQVGVSISSLADVIDPAAKKFHDMPGEFEEAVKASAGLSRIMNRSPLEAFGLIGRVREAFPKSQVSEIKDVLARVAAGGDENEFVEQVFRVRKLSRNQNLSLTESAAALIAKQAPGRSWIEAGKEIAKVGVSQKLVQEGLVKLQSQPGFDQSLGGLGDDLTSKLTRLKNALFDLGRAFGESGLLDAATALIDIVRPAVEWFSRWPRWLKITAISIGAFAAIVGPAVMGVAGFLTAIQTIKSIGPGIIAALRGIGGAMKLLNIISKANPWVMLATIVVSAIMLIANHWDWIVAKIKDFTLWVNEKASWLVPQSLVDWASAPAGKPIQSAVPSQSASDRKRAEIMVKFKNAPPGTTVESKGDAKITTDLGISLMPQVSGAH